MEKSWNGHLGDWHWLLNFSCVGQTGDLKDKLKRHRSKWILNWNDSQTELATKRCSLLQLTQVNGQVSWHEWWTFGGNWRRIWTTGWIFHGNLFKLTLSNWRWSRLNWLKVLPTVTMDKVMQVMRRQSDDSYLKRLLTICLSIVFQFLPMASVASGDQWQQLKLEWKMQTHWPLVAGPLPLG